MDYAPIEAGLALLLAMLKLTGVHATAFRIGATAQFAQNLQRHHAARSSTYNTTGTNRARRRLLSSPSSAKRSASRELQHRTYCSLGLRLNRCAPYRTN